MEIVDRREVLRAGGDPILSPALRDGLAARLATLEVRRSNTPAIELYRSLGYRQVGVRPNYYADEGEDAIVMDLDL